MNLKDQSCIFILHDIKTANFILKTNTQKLLNFKRVFLETVFFHIRRFVRYATKKIQWYWRYYKPGDYTVTHVRVVADMLCPTAQRIRSHTSGAMSL